MMKPSQLVLKLRQAREYPDKSFGEGDDDPRSHVFKVRLLVEIFTNLFCLDKKEAAKKEDGDKEEGSTLGRVAKYAALAAGAFALFKSNDAEAANKPSDFAEITPPPKKESDADREATQAQLAQPAPVVGEPPKERKVEFDSAKVTESAIKTAHDETNIKPVEQKKPDPLPDIGSEPVPQKKVQAVAQQAAQPQAKQEAPQSGSLSSLITKAASDIGVDPETLKAFVMLESSGNVKARSKTGALGLTQFTSIAWEEASNKGGKAYGIIHPIPKEIKGTDADPRFDPYKNLIAGAILIREGTKYLSKHGIEPDVTALYTYHNVGPTTTLAVYGKGKHTDASRKAIANQGAGFTEANYLSKTKQRVELAEASVRGSPPVMASVVTSGSAPVQTASSAPAVQVKPATSVVAQGASESKPVVLAAATPEATQAAPSSSTPASSAPSAGSSKPQQFYRDRNGHLVAA